MSRCIIIAGPNGSGKTTFTREIASYISDLKYINPDEIAANLRQENPLASETTIQLTAGKTAVRQIENCLNNKVGFVTETTLSSHQSMALIERAQKQEYSISLIFLGVENPTISVARVESRVAKGGHYVAPEVVSRRFPASLANLQNAVCSVDRAQIIDNTSCHHLLKLEYIKGIPVFAADKIPEWLQPFSDDIQKARKFAEPKFLPETIQQAQSIFGNTLFFQNESAVKKRTYTAEAMLENSQHTISSNQYRIDIDQLAIVEDSTSKTVYQITTEKLLAKLPPPKRECPEI